MRNWSNLYSKQNVAVSSTAIGRQVHVLFHPTTFHIVPNVILKVCSSFASMHELVLFELHFEFQGSCINFQTILSSTRIVTLPNIWLKYRP